jgi:hypothetical protein
VSQTNINRNDACPCGSGKKYKQCCLGSSRSGLDRKTTIALTVGGVALVVAAILRFTVGKDPAIVVAGIGVIAAGAWWLFTDPPQPRGPGDPGAISFGG